MCCPTRHATTSFRSTSFISVDRSLYSGKCELYRLVTLVGRDAISTERSYGFYITSFVAFMLIAGIFLWPLTFSTAISVTDMSSIIIFISIMMVSLLGCGLPDRERPHFQFHYHGEEFPVMYEMKEEVME